MKLMENKQFMTELEAIIEKYNLKEDEEEKREFVGEGFIKCYADFQDFKAGETYWLEYVGNNNYNVRSDNLLGKTYHLTPCQLYSVFRAMTWLDKQKEKEKIQSKTALEGITDKPVDCYIRQEKAISPYGTKDCERVSSFKIEKGKWYMCIKSVIYNGVEYFTEGQVYNSHADDKLETNVAHETMGAWIYALPSHIEDYFRPATVGEILYTPKFKVGDWITDGEYTWLIEGIHNSFYDIVSPEGCGTDDTISHVDGHFRLWTIQDAKEGDVLANDYFIVIFKRLWQCKTAFDWSCGIEFADNIWTFDSMGEDDFDPTGFHPATKKQRDLLFSKIKEAGYKWNKETHELKKIVKRWRDDETQQISGYVINNPSAIYCIDGFRNSQSNYNVFASGTQAKSALAMARISQIMTNDERFGGVVSDEEWADIDFPKAIIYRDFQGNIERGMNGSVDYTLLAFHTAEQRDTFLNENYDLVCDYLMIPKDGDIIK